ncbi:hypothetical protein BS78_05G206600 [Paspalum vaginatum]|nr:hypothetical protein BS78_05G206600 [Paspalum vaginatum]
MLSVLVGCAVAPYYKTNHTAQTSRDLAMATNLASGISNAAVEALVDKVKSAIKEEKEQWEIVQRDAVFITDELETMQSFLNSAIGVHIRTDVTRTWVRQVRNLSYDFEDCIECILHLDTDKRGSWWLRLLPSCSCSSEEVALPVDAAVTQIKQLRVRVEDVSMRRKRYRFVSDDSGSHSLAPQQLASSSGIGSPSGFNIIADDGREKAARRSRDVPVVDLTKLVNEGSNDRQVISVWGAGDDLGTLSVIRNMYDDSVTKGNFKCRAWVKVMHPINPPEFIRSLLFQFYANSCQDQGLTQGMNALSRLYLKLKRETDALSWTGTSAGDLVKEFVRQINRHRYLIVLEDLSSLVQWEAVSPYLQERKNGSRIVVSTRHHEIARLCTGRLYQVSELQGFSIDQSVCVFFTAGSQLAVGGAGDDYVLVGRELEVKKLWNLITDSRPHPNNHRVVSVWGFPGSGKTAVVTKVFDTCSKVSYEVRGYLRFDSWNAMNMYQESKRISFCKWLLSHFDLVLGPLVGQNPVQQCQYLLENYKCLVVVDELQSNEDWDDIFSTLIYKKSESSHKKEKSESCIIVVAPDESVAIHCAGADNLVCTIKSLQAEAAFDLLKQAVEINNRQLNSFVDEVFLSSHNMSEEQAYRFIFGMNRQEQATLYNGDSHEEQASQNSGDSIREHSSQNNGNSFNEEILWNNNSLEQMFFSLFEVNKQGQNYFQYGSSFEKQPFQNNENSRENQAFQNDGSLLGEPLPELQDFINSSEEKMSLGNPNVKAILSRSGGLPQVIVALGRYLANHHIPTRLIDNFMQELHISPEFYCLRGLITWMRTYFWSGPPSLMRCMLYLLIFPPGGQTFRRRRLVRRWIAEGFAKGIESNNSDGIAGELFDKLASQGVIQQAAAPTPTTMEATRYEVLGFFHEYMISRPMEEKLFFPLEVSVLEEGQYSLGTERIGQHLAIGSRWGRDEFVFHNLDLSRLRSLTVSGEWRSFFISGKMRVLRVLDLEGTSNVKVDDLDEIGELLPRLKYLSLRECKEITRLPDSIGGLRQLQTLDVRHTSVVTLPPSVTKLQKLQYVRAGTTVALGDAANTVESSTPTPAAAAPSTPSTSRPSAATLMSRFPLPRWTTRRRSQLAGSGNGGVNLPRGVGKMMALHTLGVINVSVASGHAVLEELKNLTQLRKLGVSGVNRENCMELCSAISRHANLESLSVSFDMGMNQAGCLDAITVTAPEILQSLKLYRHVDCNLPSWIRPELVLNLSKLHLHMTTISQVETEVLGDLPMLRTLCLYFEEFQGSELQFQRGFKSLQVLEIVRNQSLQAITFHSGVMYNLEFLKLCCCGAAPSSLRFTGLKELKSLNRVLLSGSYNDELEQHLQSQLDEHPRKFKPVLKVC